MPEDTSYSQEPVAGLPSDVPNEPTTPSAVPADTEVPDESAGPAAAPTVAVDSEPAAPAYGETDPGTYGAPSAPPGYPPPGFPVPMSASAPPPKKSRTGLIVGLVVVVLLLCGGVVTAGMLLSRKAKTLNTDAAAATSTPPAVTTPTPTATESASPDHSGDLRRFLVSAPKGSKSVSKPLGKNNTFTATQESKDFKDPTWRVTMLSVHDFQAGAVRQWEQTDSLVGVQLYRFARPTSASSFMAEETSEVTFFTEPQTMTTVKNVPDGRIYYTKKKDKSHNTHAVAVATCGDVAIEVYVDTYGTVSNDFVGIMLRKQYVRLCP